MYSESTSEMLNHMLFHKALISEEHGGERIEEYMALIRSLDRGQHIAINDEFDRSIVLIFDLVMEHHFDPWDIDLKSFSKLYLKKIRKEKEVDLITAGQIMFLAWSVLKLQSDNVLFKADEPEDETFYFEGWEIPYEDETQPTKLDYTTAIMRGVKMPLEERIWHRSCRPVTLMELVDAFDDARREANRHKVLNDMKKKLREQRNVQENFDEKVHKEDLEEDVRITWRRICEFDVDEMLLDDIVDGTRDDLIARFVSLLFLAIDNRILVRQKRFPYGEITITNITPVEERLLVPMKVLTGKGSKPSEEQQDRGLAPV